MLPEIRLTISQNDQILQTINKAVDEQNLIQTLIEFQTTANAVLTKMIEDLGDSCGDCNMDEEDGDSEEEEQISSKKKKT